ncbi:hypothetical protein QA612_13840 [Evansella sp. AB-P1]|uniref:HAAS domain-containing protein n=1 Tax=Evansella sp. AB-P1 TaxID=3037653 RepID=UPI00241CC2D0|nr:hypothetical protein [Evansella sp. AB-P1]MDG5788563.1 hypothetical protein [Evansella sp. AB-P1]
MEKLKLSDKSRKFLDDLNVYLFSSGKKEEEIKDIVEELEAHLYEAELDGKPIEQIVGESPKQYMAMISKEMNIDYTAWAKYIPIIVFGVMAFMIIGDVLEGPLSYSLLQIIGTIVTCLLFIFGVFITFRYVSYHDLSKKVEFMMIILPISISMLLFILIQIVNRIYETPSVEIGGLGSILLGIIALILLIGMSLWGKTAVMLVVLIALHLPAILLSLTTLQEETQLISSIVITYIIIGLYFYGTFKKMKKEEKSV